jgi:hypothetical protein
MGSKKHNHSPVNLCESKQSKVNQFFNKWKYSFIERIKDESKSTKQLFGLDDAIKLSVNSRTPEDEVMIEYHRFTNSHILESYDYYKYLLSYKKGKKLKDKFFKYDLLDLHKYYKRIDEDPQYFPFSKASWERYVLYMLLKFNGQYKSEEMDDVFNVKVKDNREYNPLTSIAKPLRALLPKALQLLEYDIGRAYPTFIDLELSIEREKDIYSIMDKKKLNTLLNIHKDIEGSSYDKATKALQPVYGDKASQLMTLERFNQKGKMFKDFAKYEEEYINKFVEANQVKDFVRLHDAVLVHINEEIFQTEFGKVQFEKSVLKPPKVINTNQNFYKIVNGKVHTDAVSYKKFFLQEKFIRITEEGNDKIIVFKNTNKVVKPFNFLTNTASYLASEINEYDTSLVERKLAKDLSKTIKDGFYLIPPKTFKYYRDAKLNFGLPFSNGFCQLDVKLEGIEIMSYVDVQGFFPEHSIQKIKFTPQLQKHVVMSEFERFIAMVSTGRDSKSEKLTDGENMIFLEFVKLFGYLCHTYKNPSFSPSIILSDHNADDKNRNGGRGKTIFAKAVGFVQKQLVKGGKEFDGGYRHRFADLDESFSSYLIDDVPPGFKYDDLYTNIVGDISTEPKGSKSKSIKFEYAPKFIITTNWAVMFDENAYSTNRRFMEYKFTDYFNKERLPHQVFEHNLFTDWDENEWDRFYNFVFVAVGLYLQDGLQALNYDKGLDNYRALFNNEAVENEFERIFAVLVEYDDGFTVNDFLSIYQKYDNQLRYEKFFHKNNVKNMVNVYIYKHKLNIDYVDRDRKWKVQDKIDTEGDLDGLDF